MALGEATADLIIGSTMGALGIWALRVGWRNRINLALAAVLIVRGLENVVQGFNGLPALEANPTLAMYVIERLLEDAIVATMLSFAAVAWGVYRNAAAYRWLWVIWIATAVNMWIDFVPGFTFLMDNGVPRNPAGAIGLPDALSVTVPDVARAASVVVLAWLAARVNATVRPMLTISAAGLATYTAYRVGRAIGGLPDCLTLDSSWCRASPEYIGLMAASIGFVLLFLIYTFAFAMRQSRLDRDSRWGLLAGVLAVATLLGLATWTPGIPGNAADRILQPASVAAHTLLMFYGILRYQVYGLDIRVKWTIRQSTVIGIIIGTFFIVSEGMGLLFRNVTGSEVYGILAAGGLLFILAPIQRLADRVSKVAVPNTKPTEELDDAERLALYQEQVEFAWADGVIDVNERRRLDRLRTRLGLSVVVAAGIETRVVG